ncbi:AzlC family ABC transporter permease [Varibaculum vaginae]|uniref:AzlC family ABC transporter permease n=1 Tax=Varibaculum vaginae TaxID=2364797 RepID=UPI001F39661C|nr:AzlC family ABC transporter permease [Varibaculum vaginae]
MNMCSDSRPPDAQAPQKKPASALKQAARLTGPVGMGYLPLGIAFGAFAVTQGFPIWMTIVSAVIIYAGSMEFTAVSLILGGIDLFQIALTTLFVNFRHVFYGLSFPLRKIKSAPARIYAIHSLTDEAYALNAAHLADKRLTGSVVLSINLLCHLYWVGGVTGGAFLGKALPFDTDFLGFALPALFVTLAIDAYRQSDYPLLGLAALACGLIGAIWCGKYMLITALSLFTVVVLLHCTWVMRRSPSGKGGV